MIPLLLALVALQGAVMAVFLFRREKNPVPSDPAPTLKQDVAELERRIQGLEVKWVTVLEELDERIERGNVAWRRLRAAEAGKRRRQSMEDDEDDEEPPEESTQPDFFNAPGSDPRGLSYMREPVAGSVEPPWRLVARQIAQNIAGRDA